MRPKPPSADYQEPRSSILAKSFGTLALGIAAVNISYQVYRVQSSAAETQRVNAERDIKLKQDDAKFKADAEAARVATSVLPYLKCADDLQRASALALLTNTYRALFIDRIEAQCSGLSAQDKSQLTVLKTRSADDAVTQTFLRILGNAREYKAGGFAGPASRLFHDAHAALPQAPKWPINKDAISRAEDAFANGDFSKSADLFAIGFEGIPNAP